MLPEKGNLLFQGTLGADHPVHPVAVEALQGGSTAGGGEVPVNEILIEWRLVFRAEQLFNRCFLTLRNVSLQFFPGSAETGAAHQVGHQCKVFSHGHVLPLFLIRPHSGFPKSNRIPNHVTLLDGSNYRSASRYLMRVEQLSESEGN